MRQVVIALVFALLAAPLHAQTRKPAAPKRPAPTRRVPAAPPPLTRVPATLVCPSELGDGVTTKRRFCDVLTGRDPKDGILVTIPPHVGTATLSFEVHNRHTYSAELVARKTAYRHYTATIGVLLAGGTLVDRAVIDSEVRTDKDLFDRIGGGAGPGGVKAVARLVGTCEPADIIANHLMGIYELAAIHLGQNPPNFAEATVAIEALRAVVDRLDDAFGENAAVLRQALSQLQLTFVQLKEHAEAIGESPDA